ncbi:MAG: S-layer homology domain-containing protein [Tissierellia bacterium]|nr:S-layer homology domain-containing protein [Tissierellia bacterium]MDD4677762.1 S-layer homology domain-containing protein [Tissierellia bacterium]
MRIIKKSAAFGLCVLMAINMNTAAYADVLDDIIGSSTIEDVEDVENNEEADTNVESEDVTENDITILEADEIKTSNLFSDIDGHWAKEWIESAVKIGFVSGYEDGTFKPERTITRAEFSTMLNNAIQIEITEKLNFSDVRESDWFYNEIQKSVAAGFFSGYENNTFRPNNPIKREEVAKVVAGAITTGNIEGEGATLLKDYNTIQEWAKESVNTVYNKGYILGYPNKTYMPSKALTRGEAVKIIFEIVDNENIEYGFNITNYNESYSSAVVVGNLNVLDSVGNGNVYIKNVVVLGDIVISAKDVKSVELTDVKARNIIVEGENNPVKLIHNENVIIAKK